jgi:hypothetical protein
MRHRESFALEKSAPSREESTRADGAARPVPAAPVPQHTGALPSPRSLASAGASGAAAVSPARPPAGAPPTEAAREILIVASKLKAYVRARSGMNTSDAVLDVLSDAVRALCDEAIQGAKRDGRKTVMDRDFSRRR